MENIPPLTFFEACVKGDIAIVRQFIDEGHYPIDIKNENNWTGLIMACFNEQEQVVKLLLANGANINATNHKGTTVFMYAKTPVQQKQTQVGLLTYLLEQGADINAKDRKGLTVLDYVVHNGYTVLADWMRSQGAKTSEYQQNDDGVPIKN
ncbi:MAG: ankyrin repeat domain-containing protein [Allomuricauda sp.]|nr:MAG: ankyrin repeat domain-containing protein [Allomuricauda sp.]